MQVGRAVSAAVGIQCPSTLAFDYPSVQAMVTFIDGQLCSLDDPEELAVAVADLGPPPVRAAVVGVGVRFPAPLGQPAASNSELAGGLLWAGADCIQQTPLSRFDVFLDNSASLFFSRRRDPLESFSRHGSFIGDLDLMDLSYFGMVAADAMAIEPQQRVLLQAGGLGPFSSGSLSLGTN